MNFLRCWFKRSKTDDWAQGAILGYTTNGAVVKVDRKGEVIVVPFDRLSAHDNKPADGDDFYVDPRYVVENPPAPAAVERPAPATVARPVPVGASK